MDKKIYTKLSVVIPVFNEKNTILEIIKRVEEADAGISKEIVLVDDYSTDGTRQVLGSLDQTKYKVVLKEKNGGKGSAVKAGIRAATGDLVIFQDADLEYDPNDYKAMVKPVLDGQSVAVMGVRYENREKLKPMYYRVSSLGNKAITILTNLLYLNNAGEYEGCYKVFTKELLDSININSDGFEYDNELVCKVLKKGIKTVDVPIHYYPRSYEEGKKIKIKDGLKILWTIIKYRFIN